MTPTLDQFRIALGEICTAASLYANGERAINAKEEAEIEKYVSTCYGFLRGMEDERTEAVQETRDDTEACRDTGRGMGEPAMASATKGLQVSMFGV